MSTQEQNKATVTRIYGTCWNKGDMAAIDEIFAADVKHEQFLPDWPTGREGFQALSTPATPRSSVRLRT